MRITVLVCSSALVLMMAGVGAAQTPPRGTLRVTVVDPSGAVIPGAQVTVTGIDPATSGAMPIAVVTSPGGVAEIPQLMPGRYAVQAEFPGFEGRRLPDVRIRAGVNNQVLPLAIETQKDAVVVQQDRQAAAADRGASFGTVLTREQLEALSDDPDTLRQQLQDMAGPGAVIKVDSFEGAALPPKAMIQSIRISRDQFAAENHNAGGTQIEVVTQPGLGPIRVNTAVRSRIDQWGGGSPFAPTRGPEQNRNYFANVTGTLVPNKASFNIFASRQDTSETPNINAALGGGVVRAEALRIRTPRDNMGLNVNVDYAVTLDQTLRVALNRNTSTNRNLGIGAFDEEQRAYTTENGSNQLRLQHFGPLGRRGYIRNRLQFGATDSASRAAFESITIRVNDAFTGGGAQVAGGQHARTFGAGTDIDYVRGINSYRVGLSVDAGRYRANDTTNYLGTYTFESLGAYLAGRPRSFTQRIGDPNIGYRNLQGAVYVQDDLRVRRNLTVSAGLRYEAQTHVRDYNNVMPRVGVTFAPFADGRTTLRSSWGLFSDWLATNTYEQTLRLDGTRQREVDLRNPSFPDPGSVGSLALPANRYLLGDLALPTLNRASVGIDQRLAPKLQSNVTYSYVRGGSVAHGVNLNAPVNGVRPDPNVGNVIAVVSDAKSRQQQVAVALTANPGALLPLGARAPLLSFGRTTLFANYTWATNRSNSEGPFAVSPSGTLATEWGPAAGGAFFNGVFNAANVHHRYNVTLNSQVVRNLLLSVNVNGASGAPYSIRTGADDNGDSIFNDRPAGVGRNTERGAAQWTLNTQFGYVMGFGRQVGGPPGVAVIGNGAAPTVITVNENPRYRVQFIVSIQNLTNHSNYSGYVGTLTSPFFGRPTAVSLSRKVDFGVNLGF